MGPQAVRVTLFDTDVLIDALRGDETAIRRLVQSEADGLAISAITRMELVVGCRDRREINALYHFLRRFETVHVTVPVSARRVTPRDVPA